MMTTKTQKYIAGISLLMLPLLAFSFRFLSDQQANPKEHKTEPIVAQSHQGASLTTQNIGTPKSSTTQPPATKEKNPKTLHPKKIPTWYKVYVISRRGLQVGCGTYAFYVICYEFWDQGLNPRPSTTLAELSRGQYRPPVGAFCMGPRVPELALDYTQCTLIGQGAYAKVYKVMINDKPYVLRISKEAWNEEAWQASKKLPCMVKLYGNFFVEGTGERGTCIEYIEGKILNELDNISHIIAIKDIIINELKKKKNNINESLINTINNNISKELKNNLIKNNLIKNNPINVKKIIINELEKNNISKNIISEFNDLINLISTLSNNVIEVLNNNLNNNLINKNMIKRFIILFFKETARTTNSSHSYGFDINEAQNSKSMKNDILFFINEMLNNKIINLNKDEINNIIQELNNKIIHIIEYASEKLIPIDYSKMIKKFKAFCEAMQFTGLIHGDMNNGNIIVDKKGNIRFIDFSKRGDPSYALPIPQRLLIHLVKLKISLAEARQSCYGDKGDILKSPIFFDYLIEEVAFPKHEEKSKQLRGTIWGVAGLYEKLKKNEMKTLLTNLGKFKHRLDQQWIADQNDPSSLSEKSYIQRELKNLPSKDMHLKGMTQSLTTCWQPNSVPTTYYVTYLINRAFPPDTKEGKLLANWEGWDSWKPEKEHIGYPGRIVEVPVQRMLFGIFPYTHYIRY